MPPLSELGGWAGDRIRILILISQVMGEILAGSLEPQPVARIRTQVRIPPAQRTTAALSLPPYGCRWWT